MHVMFSTHNASHVELHSKWHNMRVYVRVRVCVHAGKCHASDASDESSRNGVQFKSIDH